MLGATLLVIAALGALLAPQNPGLLTGFFIARGEYGRSGAVNPT